MNPETFAIARNYFRTFDEEEKNYILFKAGEKMAYYIRDLENIFTYDDRIEDIANKLSLSSFVTELRDMRIDYFISLAEMYKAGHKTRAIEMLLKRNNKLFQKVCAYVADDGTFEQEIDWAIKLANREKFMAAYKRNSEIQDLESVHSVQREPVFDTHLPEEVNRGDSRYSKYLLIVLALIGLAALLFYLFRR
jgi:hypothetical protein